MSTLNSAFSPRSTLRNNETYHDEYVIRTKALPDIPYVTQPVAKYAKRNSETFAYLGLPFLRFLKRPRVPSSRTRCMYANATVSNRSGVRTASS